MLRTWKKPATVCLCKKKEKKEKKKKALHLVPPCASPCSCKAWAQGLALQIALED